MPANPTDADLRRAVVRWARAEQRWKELADRVVGDEYRTAFPEIVKRARSAGLATRALLRLGNKLLARGK